MSEKRKLSDALKSDASTKWKTTALAAIADEQVTFAGNPGSGASSTARILLKIYRIRLRHCQERRVQAHGITELVEFLAGCPESTVIEVQPFLGPAVLAHSGIAPET
jgi:hypothetical protein